MGNRIGHRKSRNGCLWCKKRRVKCDEKRPCTNCARHEVLCSLVAIPPRPAPAAQASSLGIRHETESSSLQEAASTSRIRDLIHQLSDEVDQFAGGINDCKGRCHKHHLQDLRLMHHFSTVASLTIIDEPCARRAWQVTAPDLSFQCDILRHAILAFSALHRAHILPNERDVWMSAAQRHQKATAGTFVDSAGAVTGENADSFFLYTLLNFTLRMHWLAQSLESCRISEISRCFVPLQDLRSLLLSDIGQHFGQGSISSLFVWCPQIESTPPLAKDLEISSRIQQLEKLARGETELEVRPENAEACLAALQVLDMTCRAFTAAPVGHGRVWSWPFFLPERFVNLLHEEDPLASVILVYYAALVRSLEDNAWYCKGWSAKVSFVVGSRLPRPWMSWVEWPHRCIQHGRDIRSIRM